MLTLSSIKAPITQVSTIVGVPNAAVERIARAARSLAARLAVLLVAFAAVPAFLYGQFHAAEDAKRGVLLRTLQAEGHLIAQGLRIGLDRSESPSIMEARALLARLDPRGMKVRLLFRPAGSPDPGAVFLIGAAPQFASDNMDAERRELLAAGIVSRTPASCDGSAPLDVRYRSPNAGYEILTSMTPFNTAAGCWSVLTSHSLMEFTGSLLDRPYWQAREVRLAAAIYALLALLVVAMFSGLWRNLNRFGHMARAIRAGEAGPEAFARQNRIPELEGVADEFDHMVEGLRASAEAFRMAAEENAHAFKTPVATIAQAIEPLKAAIPEGQPRAVRALQVIDASVARLDTLIAAARQMDETNASLVNPPRQRVDLSGLAETMLASYEEMMAGRSLVFQRDIAPRCLVWAGPDLLETVIENLLDNAIGFSPPEGSIAVRIAADGRSVTMAIEDDGPGAPLSVLQTMFERYVSHRPAPAEGEVAESHFGIGLWIVKRNLAAVGGHIHAENRPRGGLRMTVTLKRAE